MNNLEKTELTTSIYYIVRFLKSGILIYNSKFWIPLAEKQEEEEEEEKEHRQLQSVRCFMQTQKDAKDAVNCIFF